MSSSASSDTTTTATGISVPSLGVTVGAGQVLLVRGPVHSRFPILSEAWFEIGEEYLQKQFASAKVYLVKDGTDPNADQLPMNITYMRLNLAEVKEHKVVARKEADELLQKDAEERFDRENKKKAEK